MPVWLLQPQWLAEATIKSTPAKLQFIPLAKGRPALRATPGKQKKATCKIQPALHVTFFTHFMAFPTPTVKSRQTPLFSTLSQRTWVINDR